MAFRGVDSDVAAVRDLARQLQERSEAIYLGVRNLNSFNKDMADVLHKSGHASLSSKLGNHAQTLNQRVAYPLQEAARRLERLANELQAIKDMADRL